MWMDRRSAPRVRRPVAGNPAAILRPSSTAAGLPRTRRSSDRARRALRPSREASKRPRTDAPSLCRRGKTGEVYPGPRARARGFFLAARHARPALRCRPPPVARRTFRVRSLPCSAGALIWPAWRADSRKPRPDAGYRDRRAAVGRRGQGQDDRLPGRADGHGRALPGWRQRRPHRRPRATRSSSSS